ncbi:MAG: sigma-54-dependent Fis family transcriptional regulator, partial [Nitrospiraceae bacterium]
MSIKILIADDEEVTVKHLIYSLEDEGYDVTSVNNGTDAFKKIGEEDFDLLITDIKMPGMDGLTLLNKVKDAFPTTEVIIITGIGSIESAVDSMRKGAIDYITKPFNLDEVLIKIEKIKEIRRLERENLALKVSLGLGRGSPIIAKSPMMKKVIDIVSSIISSDCNVLITGESGVGKGMVSKLIHYSGLRKENLFLPVNCATFTEELLASELFGHIKGAFTGAVANKQGLLEIAHNGTLFLDEIAEMSPGLQAKLLKVLEDGEFIRVGGVKSIKVDVRFIAATNQNINVLVSEGSFREDLYYRLNVMDIYIPPLRDRREDIVPLSKNFLSKQAQKANKKIKDISKDALDMLMSYGFPGNVRELENIIER